MAVFRVSHAASALLTASVVGGHQHKTKETYQVVCSVPFASSRSYVVYDADGCPISLSALTLINGAFAAGVVFTMTRSKSAAAAALIVIALYFAPLWLVSSSTGVWLNSSSSWQHDYKVEALLQQRLRRLQQNDFSGSTIPKNFTQLDRAAETQRIYRSVSQER